MAERAEHRVAVVGSGAWGANLARIFAELGALAAVVDADVTRAHAIADRFGTRPLALRDALEDTSIHGLAIATPPSSHFPVARAALEAGKHLLVEKPLTLVRDQAEALVRLAKARGRMLMVGHILRYHPAFAELERRVRQGALGRLRRIHSSRLNLGTIRAEEDALWCLAPHDVSMVLALADEMPESVSGFQEHVLGRALADAAAFRLGFPSGLSAMIQVSWLHPVKEHRLSVIGSEAMAVFDDTRPWSEKLTLYRHRVTPSLAIEREEPVPVLLAEREPLKEECRHFIARMADGGPPLTGGTEALRVMDILARAEGALATPNPPW